MLAKSSSIRHGNIQKNKRIAAQRSKGKERTAKRTRENQGARLKETSKEEPRSGNPGTVNDFAHGKRIAMNVLLIRGMVSLCCNCTHPCRSTQKELRAADSQLHADDMGGASDEGDADAHEPSRSCWKTGKREGLLFVNAHYRVATLGGIGNACAENMLTGGTISGKPEMERISVSEELTSMPTTGSHTPHLVLFYI